MMARRYAGPVFIRTILGTWGLSKTYYWLAFWLAISVTFLVGVMVGFNLTKWGMVVNSAIGLLSLYAIVVVWYTPALTLLRWVLSAIMAQPGNTPGFSTADAVRGIAADAEKFRRLLLIVLFATAAIAGFLALVPLQNAPWAVVPIAFFVIAYLLVSRHFGLPTKWALRILAAGIIIALAINILSLVTPAVWHRVGLDSMAEWAKQKESDKLAAEYKEAEETNAEERRQALLRSATQKTKNKIPLSEEERQAVEERTILGAVNNAIDRIMSDKHEKVITITPQDFHPLTPYRVCGLPSGEWTYESVSTLMKIEVAGKSNPPVSIDRRIPNDWTGSLNGVLTGGRVQIERTGCADFLIQTPEQQRPYIEVGLQNGRWRLTEPLTTTIRLKKG